MTDLNRLIVACGLPDWRKASTKKIIEPVTGLRTAIEGILFDPEDFDLIRPHKWRLTQDGYLLTSDPANRQTGIYMHRLIMNAPQEMQIDHIDGNKLDNRKSNLRICTKRQNLCNADSQKARRKGKYKGCYLLKSGRYRSTIKTNGKAVYLGEYDTEENAAQAYNFAAFEYHKEFAFYNRSGK